jgi:hypothetical protein
MAKASTSVMDVILIVFLILVVVVGVWVFDPKLLVKGCEALPTILQQVSGCR